MSAPALEQLLTLETALWEKGCSAVCGVDEAGAGPLAGPVYAAAVILAPDAPIEGLYDSKKLSAKTRERLYPQILERAAAWAIAAVGQEEIDQINILQARLKAMRLAVAGLSISPDSVLVDGDRDPGMEVDTLLVKGGDASSASIAAASILAKVARDRYMVEMAALYPQYRFEKHKGYGTALHRALILEHGPCPLHRKSFLTKLKGGGA